MTAWVVRAGAGGENEQYALDTGCATVGWGVPDLSGCRSREDVRALVEAHLPDESPHKIGATAGQLWAFRETIEPGDIVVMPSKLRSGYLTIGRCSGRYEYDHANPDASRRHRIPVTWSPEPVSKGAIKDDLLYSLNAIRTVFSPSRNNAEARLASVMETGTDVGNNLLPTSTPTADQPPRSAAPRSVPVEHAPDDDASDVLDPVSMPTLEAIQDRIRTHLVENFAGHKLTRLVADVLEVLGFECVVSPAGPDGGVDILAGTGRLGLDSPTLIVEVKSEHTAVGAPVVRGLHSAMARYQADQALLVAWGGVTSAADREFRQLRTRLRIWDADALLKRVYETYDRLPARTRAALPLRMTWVLDDESPG